MPDFEVNRFESNLNRLALPGLFNSAFVSKLGAAEAAGTATETYLE